MLMTEGIQGKKYIRENVVSAELVSAENSAVLLKTKAVIKSFANVSSDDEAMFELASKAGAGQTEEGRIFIELLEKDSVRVRYAKGTEILANDTRMVLNPLAAAKDCKFEVEQTKVTATAGNITVTAELSPYRLTVYNKVTGKTVEVGGTEKNYFNFRDSLNTGTCHLEGVETPVSTENFTLASHEAIYGFGEKFIKLNKVGQIIEFDTRDGIGIGSPRTYKNIPFYVSTNGYGAYFNHSAFMTFWVGSLYAGDIQFAVMDDFLDYYIFTGDIKTVLSTYTDLTGKTPMPPKWSFGYWQSKITYHSAEETLDIIDNMHALGIPVDVMHIDTHWFKTDWYCDYEFDGERFNPETYLPELKKRGVKLSLWQLPYVRGGSKAFEEFKAVDGFVKTKDGDMYDLRTLGVIMANSPDPVGIIDFTNPAAVEVYKEILRRLFRLGVSIIKTDFGEAAPADGVYFDGTPGYQMHNLYPLLYDKAAYEASRELNGEDALVWGRSAYAGNQRYPLYWGGDNSPNFYNIIPQLAGGLSFGMSGFPFWSQDVGGFLGLTYDKLFVRWLQFSALMSHIRVHGSGTREIYRYGEECINICRDYLQLRYKLLPYLWGTAEKCCEKSLPVTRALVVDYQDDPNVWNIEDEYLSGDSLLVAPIYTEDNKRSVYLPKGLWTDWHTGEKIDGGKWFTVEAPLDIMPLYVKEGAIIPMGKAMNYVGEKVNDEIELRIYPFADDGVTEFRVDTGDTKFNTEYRCEKGKHTVTIEKTDVKVKVVVVGDAKVEIK